MSLCQSRSERRRRAGDEPDFIPQAADASGGARGLGVGVSVHAGAGWPFSPAPCPGGAVAVLNSPYSTPRGTPDRDAYRGLILDEVQDADGATVRSHVAVRAQVLSDQELARIAQETGFDVATGNEAAEHVRAHVAYDEQVRAPVFTTGRSKDDVERLVRMVRTAGIEQR